VTQATKEVQDLAEAMSGALPQLDARDQRVAITLYRLLAHGRSVSPSELATASSAPEQHVESLLESWPAVFRDDSGNMAGFWGLTVAEMPPHEIEAGGVRLSAWCAWDTLFLPEVLGTSIRVRSVSPGSHESIQLEVEPDRVVSTAPEGLVVSFLRPDAPFDSDVITSFCHFVHFFALPEAGKRWVEEHPGTFLLSLSDAFELARLSNRRFATALGPG
jgi:alkylmercury lyase